MKEYSYYLELLETGSLRQKSFAIMAVTGFVDEHNIVTAIAALEDTFKSLLDSPRLGDLFWRKTIEGGVRGYSRLVSFMSIQDPTSNFEDRFLAIMRRILCVEDEEIIGCALTAMYQDAPLQSLPLLNEIKILRQTKREHVQRLGFLFDRCEAKLAESSGHK